MPGLKASLSLKTQRVARSPNPGELGKRLARFERQLEGTSETERETQRHRVSTVAPLLVEAMRQAGTDKIEGEKNTAILKGNRLKVSGEQKIEAEQNSEGKWQDLGESEVSSEYVEQLQTQLLPQLEGELSKSGSDNPTSLEDEGLEL